MSKVRIGISGWTFPPWRESFYPKGLPQKKELEFASRAVTSIEINGTFYSLQRPPTFQTWYRETPNDFQFAVKAPQFMTHVLRLKDCEVPLANFLASGLLCLGKKLGTILWQLPPNVTLKDDRFEKFLALLPHDGKGAAEIARGHGPKVEGRAWTTIEENFPIRHAFEFRHRSFDTPAFRSLLAKHNVAFVCAHEGSGPFVEEPTADFVYVRLHGEGPKFKKGYPPEEIAEWKKRVDAWSAESRDVYVYFSNDAKEFSPAGALALLDALGLRPEASTGPVVALPSARKRGSDVEAQKHTGKPGERSKRNATGTAGEPKQRQRRRPGTEHRVARKRVPKAAGKGPTTRSRRKAPGKKTRRLK